MYRKNYDYEVEEIQKRQAEIAAKGGIHVVRKNWDEVRKWFRSGYSGYTEDYFFEQQKGKKLMLGKYHAPFDERVFESYAFDEFGRLIKSSTEVGGESWAYEYDSHDRVVKMQRKYKGACPGEEDWSFTFGKDGTLREIQTQPYSREVVSISAISHELLRPEFVRKPQGEPIVWKNK